MDMPDFLLEDYKLKTDYLVSHLSRMWARFNMFLFVQSGLLAFSFQRQEGQYVWTISAAGVIMALIWYFFAANDNFLTDHFRDHVRDAHTLLTESKCFNSNSDKHTCVSDPDAPVPVKSNTFLSRRNKNLCATELAVIFPWLFIVAWIVRFGLCFTMR